MILEIEEAKQWLRVDHDEDDMIIQNLIKAAESYLKNATGKTFGSEDELAKLFCLYLITDWYENREYLGRKVGEKVKYIVQSMLTQLQHGEGGTKNEV